VPRYIARVDLTGSSSDAEASFSALADSAEDTAGRIQEAFDDASKEAGGSLDDIGGKADDSAGSIADSFEESVGKVSGSLDDLAGTAAEKAEAIGGAFGESFATVGSSAELMQARFAEVLDGMVAQTTTSATLISARLDEAFAKSALAAKEMAEGSAASVAKVGEASAAGGAAKSAEASGLVGGLSKVGEFTLLGGIAAVIGSLDLSGKLQTAEANLKTALKNSGSGVSWKGFQPGLNSAINQGAANGFDDTDVVAALASLTSATKSPREALQLLVQDENEARLHQISLSESTGDLTKILGGSTRALAAWGINLDIGSGKAHSVQQAQEAVTKDTMAYRDALAAASQAGTVGSQNQVQAMITEQQAATTLAESRLSGSNAVANALEAQKAAQAEVESGQVKGAAAVALIQKTDMALTEAIEGGSLRRTASALAYEKALDSTKNTTERDSYAQIAALEKVATTRETLANAKLNLSEDKNAIPLALSTLAQRSAGAASAFDKTLPGELKIADAEVKRLGADFGDFLTPGIEHFGHAVETDIGWLLKHNDALDAVGVALTGFAALSVGVFAERKIAKAVSATKKAYEDLEGIGKKLFHIGSSSTSSSSASQTGQVGTASQTSADQVTTLGGAAEGAQAQIVSLGGAAETSAGQIAGLGGASEKSAGTIAASSTEAQVSLAGIGDAAEATAATEEVAGAEGGEGIAAMLGPIGLVAFAALEVAEHWKLVKEVAGDVWHFLDSNVVHPMERGFDWLKDEIGSHLGEIERDAKKFGPALLLLLGPIGLIAGGAIELVEHWKTVSRVFDEVVTDVERGWDRLEGDVTSLWNTVERDTTTGVGKVVSFVESLPTDVERLFADAGTWLLDAGENLLLGLVKGIGNEETAVLKKAEDVGKGVLHDLTHPWDVLSPSKKTAEAGGYLVQGISVGMESELPGLLADADRIGRSVLAELEKGSGESAGRAYMVTFARGISDSEAFVVSALSSVLKKASESSALKNSFSSALSIPVAGGHSLGPGGSVTYQYNVNNARIEANDPRQFGRQLDTIARRKNAVRT